MRERPGEKSGLGRRCGPGFAPFLGLNPLLEPALPGAIRHGLPGGLVDGLYLNPPLEEHQAKANA